MKLLSVTQLTIPDIKVIRFARFHDQRGYFTELYRKSDFASIDFLKDFEIMQTNESYSIKNTIRGLHFQWNPFMGKLVRCIDGHMIDIVVDIRKESPTFGKIILYDMPVNKSDLFVDWIWVPPGFAHGNLFLENSTIEYLCTGQYSQGCESGLSPLSQDFDWSLCDEKLKNIFNDIINSNSYIMTDKDKNSLSLTAWNLDQRSNFFIYSTINDRVLVTGGSGLLGTELKKLLLNAQFPSSSEFNVTDYNQMDNYLKYNKINKIIHCAAFISPPKINADPMKAIDVNIIGTSNIVKLCHKYNIKIYYISTDYVFDGTKGNYNESDPVLPTNKYAWSKLGGETAIQMLSDSVIIRTSFGPNIFPYPGAFIDQYTSRESVSQIANKISKIININVKGIVHIGGNRKTVYEYATNLDQNKQIDIMSIKDVNFNPPVDTSLDCTKYNNLVKV